MLSFVNAMNPPPMKTSKPSTIIARRVSPNATMPLSTAPLFTSSAGVAPASLAARDPQQIAEKDRPLGRDQLSGLQAFENLPVALVLQADLDRAAGEATAIGRDPYRLGAVAFPHHTGERNRNGAHRVASADHEIREHPRPQFVLRIFDLGTDQDPAGIRIDHRCDGDDLPFEHTIRKRTDLDFDLL